MARTARPRPRRIWLSDELVALFLKELGEAPG